MIRKLPLTSSIWKALVPALSFPQYPNRRVIRSRSLTLKPGLPRMATGISPSPFRLIGLTVLPGLTSMRTSIPPCSVWQVEEQPSAGNVLPSSHCSFVFRTPSPQTGSAGGSRSPMTVDLGFAPLEMSPVSLIDGVMRRFVNDDPDRDGDRGRALAWPIHQRGSETSGALPAVDLCGETSFEYGSIPWRTFSLSSRPVP